MNATLVEKPLGVDEISQVATALELLAAKPSLIELRATTPHQTRSARLGFQPEALSLPALVRELRRGNRREDAVWAVLAISALVLLALSLSLS